MKKLDNKVSVRIAEQFPEFVRADNAGIIPFLERYYEFLESAELTLTGVGAVDQLLMEDDVIGVSGYFSQTGDLMYVDDIHFPPLGKHQRRVAGEDRAVSAAFISDLHLGSKTFLEPQWHKMIQWFNEDPLAKTVRYLVISGDGVDGVGIYPNQDKELNIPDLFNQYSRLGTMLQDLPDWVEVLLLPGNHDAVRPAEPQPALDPEL